MGFRGVVSGVCISLSLSLSLSLSECVSRVGVGVHLAYNMRCAAAAAQEATRTVGRCPSGRQLRAVEVLGLGLVVAVVKAFPRATTTDATAQAKYTTIQPTRRLRRNTRQL